MVPIQNMWAANSPRVILKFLCAGIIIPALSLSSQSLIIMLSAGHYRKVGM